MPQRLSKPRRLPARRAAALALLTVAALAADAAFAVPPAQEPREPWNITAETSRAVRAPDGGRILTFEGNVVITHGALTTTADRAEYLEDMRRALLTGHVVMRQDSTVVRGPVCFYDRDERVARFPSGLVIERPSGTAVADAGFWRRNERTFELRGRVAAADTSGTLDADEVTYDEGVEIFWAIGNARLVDDESGVIVEGPSLKYARAESRARATGRPTSTFQDEDVAVRVVSDEMTYDPDTNVGVATGNVVMTRGSMEATGGTARFHRDENRAVLEDSPRVVDGASEIDGDRIEMITRPGGRRTVRVSGSARVSHRFGAERVQPVEAGTAESRGEGPVAEATERGAADAEGEGATIGGDGRAETAESGATPAGETPPEDEAAATKRLLDAIGAARDSLAQHAAEILAEIPDSTGTTPPDGLAKKLADEAAAAGTPDLAGVSPRDVVEKGLAKIGAEKGLAPTAATADSAVASPDSTGGASPDTTANGEPLPPWLAIPGDKLPTQNLLFGEDIVLDVVDDELVKVEVVGHGRSKFYPRESEGDFSEWNDVVGDTLHVWFTDSDVDSVTVFGHGTGEYRLPAGEDEDAPEEVLKEKGKLVDYEAPVIRYDRRQQMMHLEEGGQVKYRDMQLRSGTIDFDARREVMVAGGDPPPVLVDVEDEIFGQEMRYHLPSKKGEILGGRTKFEQAFYQGTDIWKMGDDVLAVENAAYTTCDREVPHYHFSSREMKIYLDDKVVAKPVVLKIRQIPVFALPFYIASLKKHRHSGFLLPNLELGVDDNRGRFIRNVGYYWAPNDYVDATTSFDFYPSQDRIVSYLNMRYNLRYRFDGRVGLKYNRDVPRGKKDTVVEITHRQTLSETADLSGDARFFSSASIYQDIDDSQRLDRDIRSNLSMTKRFPGSNRSLRVDLQKQQNLDQDTFTEQLPSVVFSQPSRPLLGRGDSGAPGGPAESASGVRGLLGDLYWNLDSRAARTRTRTTASEEEHVGAQTNMGLRMSRSLFRYWRFSPAIDGEATWIDEDRLGDANATRATYRTSVSTSTTLYGTFLKPIGPAKGFRHLIEPGASWSWAPEFREYFYVDQASPEFLSDRFFSFGGIGGTPRKDNRMSFSIRNLVQTKWAQGERETRIDLFTLRNGISYDFLADELGRKPLSSLSSSLNILSSLPVNQSWTVTHDPYTWNLLGSSVTTRARLSSRSFGRGGREEVPTEGGPVEPPPDGMTPEAPGVGGLLAPTTARGGAGSWAVDVSHTAQRGATGSASSGLVVNSSWSPTENWAVSYNTQYDLRNGQNTAQSWSVRRQVHCWEISFDRRLLGGEWQYYLRVNVIDLPDIKAERGDSFRGRASTGTALDGLF